MFLLGELCPASVRGFSSNAATFVAFSSIFLLVKLFPSATAAFGLRAVFFFLAAVCIANTIFCATLLPETAGKTLAEVEKMFDKKEKPVSNQEILS